jgi:hypothetical protein
LFGSNRFASLMSPHFTVCITIVIIVLGRGIVRRGQGRRSCFPSTGGCGGDLRHHPGG